jgi:hypothetical protein
VAFASRPFLDSFVQQTSDLGVRDTPIIVIDAEVCHPGPVRRQVRGVLGLMVEKLISPPGNGEERIFWAQTDQ